MCPSAFWIKPPCDIQIPATKPRPLCFVRSVSERLLNLVLRHCSLVNRGALSGDGVCTSSKASQGHFKFQHFSSSGQSLVPLRRQPKVPQFQSVFLHAGVCRGVVHFIIVHDVDVEVALTGARGQHRMLWVDAGDADRQGLNSLHAKHSQIATQS